MREAELTVYFAPPGFFLTDVHLLVRLGDELLYEGSFTSGFERTVRVTPGAIALSTELQLGMVRRSKRYELVLEAGPRRVELRYSRFWGNFKGALA